MRAVRKELASKSVEEGKEEQLTCGSKPTVAQMSHVSRSGVRPNHGHSSAKYLWSMGWIDWIVSRHRSCLLMLSKKGREGQCRGPRKAIWCHLWGDLRYDKFVAWCEKSSKSLNKVQPTLCRLASVSVVQWMNDEMSCFRCSSGWQIIFLFQNDKSWLIVASGLLGKMNQHRATTFFYCHLWYPLVI